MSMDSQWSRMCYKGRARSDKIMGKYYRLLRPIHDTETSEKGIFSSVC